MIISETLDNEKTQQAKNKLVQYINDNWKIFIDTCSFLSDQADVFFPHLIDCLQKNNGKIFVPIRVCDEIEKKLNDKKLKNKAKQALDYIHNMRAKKIIDIRGEKSDKFADNVFQVVFTKFRTEHKLLLITQDVELAKDINNLNQSGSVKGKPVHVQKISQYGYLSSFNFGQNGNSFSTKDKVVKKKSSSTIDKFRLSSQLTTLQDKELNLSYIPSSYDTVLGSDSVAIKLGNKISEGGEGAIYETNTPYVAKIYKKGKNTLLRCEKIKLMTSKRLNCEGICYPIDMLFNTQNEFIGYLMPKAKGKTLQRSFFIRKLLEKNFPDWSKLDSVRLCITILEKIKYLHDRNIILGDINPENILVVSPTEVYFVDTDSYQVEGFPCPVGTVNYTAPEIQKKGNYKDYLRTFGNENFAIATLLFMIMLPGKPPYSQQGGESQQDNILKMDFSYPFKEYSNKKTSEGPWRYIWSHLIHALKKAFFQTFRKNEMHSEEHTRLNVQDWLHIFREYERLLSTGKLLEQDSMSGELFPTRHKKQRDENYIVCKVCHQEVNEKYSEKGVCKKCLSGFEIYSCSRCNKEIKYTNYQKYLKNELKPRLCKECDNIAYESDCIDCGQHFTLTKKEYQFYQSKGFDIPKRCKVCRNNKDGKNTKSQNKSAKVQSTISSNNSNVFLSNLFKNLFS